MKIDGGCHCGKITYRAEIDPDAVFICHCSDCQNISGAPYRTVVRLAEADFELLSGEPRVYVKTADSGNLREQVFCPDCGSPLYATSVGGEPRALGLRVGSIRQRDRLVPKSQYFCDSAQPWVSDLTGISKVSRE